MTAEVIVDIAHSEVDRIFEYNCPFDVKEGGRVKVPFGGRIIDGIIIKVKQNADFGGKLKDIISQVDPLPALTKESLFLAENIKGRYFVSKAVTLRLFLPSEMRKGKVKELFTKTAFLSMPVESAFSIVKSGAKAQRAAIEYLHSNPGCNLSFLNAEFSRSAVKALEDKKIIDIEERQKLRTPLSSFTERSDARTLTPAQADALTGIDGSSKRIHLIHGVTGSGKTEIYLTLIKRAIEADKTAIFLVPEISLTPQMLKELRSRFGELAAILHSGLSSGERFDEWWRLRRGEAKIAIGARSAVFAPLENLGVIVIDEEHDGSYISETAPRYSTIDIAKIRAGYNGCMLVLGSATPSVESYLSAIQGEYNLITLPERINKKPMPEIIMADMRIEVKRGNNSAFSHQLVSELKKCLDGGNQAIIFLNRRGYAQHVVCRECGYVAMCADCDVTLTYHSGENLLKCHYCGNRYKMPAACPDCGGVNIKYSGTGTEKVVYEIKRLFPGSSIIRMDNDTTSGKEGHYKILKEFGEKRADILVGTQMIAKGHDFPSVTMVGILDADMSLHFSDYRSRERTFQLLTQVSGRSGRADEKGVVVLQTYNPESEVLNYAVTYNYDEFFKREVALRRAASYPPFAYILRVMALSEDREKAIAVLKKVYADLEELYYSNRDSFIFFNKMNSPIKKLSGKYRFQVLMRFKDAKLIEQVYVRSIRHTDKNVLVYVEENPNNLS